MTNSKLPPGRKQLDEESKSMLYQGVSMAQVCTIFGMDLRDVQLKLNGRVQPCGVRSGYPIYQIKDVAPYLVKPPYDIDEFIQRMSIADLPTILRKEYWAGMRSRQLFEKEAAELWPTADVVDMVTTLFKTVRMSMLLTREAVERETELTPRQREIITRIIDNTLEETYAKTVKKFSEAKSDAQSADLQSEEVADSEDL